MSILAGSTIGFLDGVGTAARFSFLFGVAVDAAGNVYVADVGNYSDPQDQLSITHPTHRYAPAVPLTTIESSTSRALSGDTPGF